MQTFGQQRKISLRHVSLMHEISAFSSAIADVALSDPWLGILPIALYGSKDLPTVTHVVAALQ
jgi:acyl-CoA dehydrogenase